MTRHISNLPIEILIKIFKYLPASEILKLSEVCYDWLNITQNSSIMNKTVIKKSESVDLFLQTFRKFNFSLSFESSLPENFLTFTHKFSENIQDLSFKTIKLSNFYDFIANLTNLTNLKNLEIINCSFEGEGCSPSPDDLCLNLNTLLLVSFESFDSIKGFEVDQLLSIIPRLQILSCILNDDPCYQRAIVKYLTNPKLTKFLKELHFISFDNADIISPVFKTNHLRLEKFFWTCFREINCVSDLELFLSNQTSLKVLDLMLNATPCSRNIVKICSKLKLEQLTFNMNNEKLENCEILSELWNLKNLKIFCCNSSIFKSLNRTSKMENLTLFNYLGDLDEHLGKFEFLTSLTSLKITQTLINDTLLQAIFKNLVKLRDLRFIDKGFESEITDFGITGNLSGYPSGYSLSRLENLENFYLDVKATRLTEVSLRHIDNLKNIKNAFIPKSNLAGLSQNAIYNDFDNDAPFLNRCLNF